MWKNSYLESPLVEYVRKPDRTKKGFLVAGVNPDTNEVCIGWSVCNRLDKFNKNFGFFIAEGRALKNDRMDVNGEINDIELIESIPFSVLESLPKFMKRVVIFYKRNKFSDVAKYLIALSLTLNKDN